MPNEPSENNSLVGQDLYILVQPSGKFTSANIGSVPVFFSFPDFTFCESDVLKNKKVWLNKHVSGFFY